jgi:hypothetical protein
MRLTIRQSPKNRRAFSLASTLEKRVDAIKLHYSEDLAEEFLAHLQRLAPADLDGYPDMLEVRRFKLRSLDGAAAVVAPPSMRRYRLKEADVQRTVLEVRPKMAGRRAVDPAAVVLWQRNPWTMRTLPYEPSKREATIVSRRVSIREAQEIERRRSIDLASVVKELIGMGRPPARKHAVLLEQEVLRDLYFEVLRREFGMGDAAHVAHWRPSVRFARTVLVKKVLKSFLRWLTVPSESRWKRKLRSKPGKLSEVKGLQRFQSFVKKA